MGRPLIRLGEPSPEPVPGEAWRKRDLQPREPASSAEAPRLEGAWPPAERVDEGPCPAVLKSVARRNQTLVEPQGRHGGILSGGALRAAFL